MPKKTLVIGSAHSGKSEISMRFLEHDQPATVFGTAEAADSAMQTRIQELRAGRPETWTTCEDCYELPHRLNEAAAKQEQVLIDSLSQWIATRLVHDVQKYSLDQLEGLMESETNALLKEITAYPGPLVLVSSEVTGGITPPQPLARMFRYVTGRLNAKVAQHVDRVILVAAGITVTIKDEEKSGT